MKFSRVFPGISAMLVLCAASLSAASPVAVQQLRCEYRVEPMELDAARPRLSWILTSAQRGQKQTAYQILAAANRSTLGRNRGELWDSGRVVSDETAHIVYNGRPLSSHQSVWWKVRTWNQNGQASTWSAPASWTTGLMNSAQEWKARWIGLQNLPGSASSNSLGGLWIWSANDTPFNAPMATRYFRKQISISGDRKIRTARFVLTTDDQFTLWVNGIEAGKSNGQTDAWRQPSIVDVASLLKSGENILAIAAQNTAAGAAGLNGKLTIGFEGGNSQHLLTDAHWKAVADAPINWMNAYFDDSAWTAARVIANVGDAPWGVPGQSTLTPPAPFLRKSFALSKPILCAFAHASALGLYELHLNGQRVGNDVFTLGWTDYKKRVYY